MSRIAEKSNRLEDKKILRLSSSCFIKAYKLIKLFIKATGHDASIALSRI